MYNFNNEFSKEVFQNTYEYQNEGIEGMWARLSRAMNSPYTLLENFKFVPAGRICSNAGTHYSGTTMINCFVSGFQAPNADSMESIMAELKRQALILKSEGGYGCNFSTLRPRGSYIGGIGTASPGSVQMMDMWNTQSRVITEGSGEEQTKGKKKIRKGAMMGVLEVWHPDIEEFITAKQIPGKLTKFNISVGVTDKFMEAVQNNENWDLIFPNVSADKNKYDEEWSGDIHKWIDSGGKIKVYKTLKAKTLYDLITKSTYNRNEPGVLFIDTINKMNNLRGTERIAATNPCVAKDAWVPTANGHHQVKNLINRPTSLFIDGKLWNTEKEGFFSTGIKPVFNLNTEEGYSLPLTEDHPVRKIIKKTRYIQKEEWTQLKNLEPGDKVRLHNHMNISWESSIDSEYEKYGYILGLYMGDGHYHTESPRLCVWEDGGHKQLMEYVSQVLKPLTLNQWSKVKNRAEYRLKSVKLFNLLNAYHLSNKKEITPDIEQESASFYTEFLKGLFDADGSVQGSQQKGVSVRLSQSNLKFLQVVQRMLLRLGIKSTIHQDRRPEGTYMLPDGKGKQQEYSIKAQHELVISNGGLIQYLNRIGFEHPLKHEKLEQAIKSYKRKPNQVQFIATVKDITYRGMEEVFDVQVPGINAFDANGLYVHNCGEQPLPPFGACLLAAINATQYVDIKTKTWRIAALKRDVGQAVRFLDNVIDTTNLPLAEQRQEIKNKRRIGLGVMGLGSAFMMMQARYGHKQSEILTRSWFDTVANAAYQASALLAKEKGAFPLWNYDTFIKGGFSNILSQETLDLIKKYGLRNSHLLTVAPTGNTGIMANSVSGGFEPVFMPEYIRTSGCDVLPEGLIPKGKITQKWVTDNWTETKEGDVIVYKKDFNNVTYKYDVDRGFTKESWIRDYGVQNLIDRDLWEPNAEWAATTTELSVRDHTNIMNIVSQYVDSAMSKTVNLVKDYPFEDFKKLYIDAWKTGTIKGLTTYRDGTMTSVLKSTQSEEAVADDVPFKHRPKKLECDIHHITYKGEKYVVLVGLYKGKPSELFVLSAEKGVMIGKDVTKGTIIKTKTTGEYRLETDNVVVKKLVSYLSDEEATLTRLISVGFLRPGKLEEAVKQLTKSPGSIASFSQVLKRVIVKYIKEQNESKCPDCGEDLVMEEGCEKCMSCGTSKCG